MKTVLYIGPKESQYWQRSTSGWQRLQRAPTEPVWAVTDLAEETVTEIAVPRVFGRDRAAFLERQLASRFADTPFRAALPGPASGSLAQRFAPPRQCLLAVDAPQRIQAALDASAAPLVGLWSGAMLLSQLGQHPTLPSDLFLALPGNGQLRIVFLKNRQPVLFRLAPAGEQPADQANEIVRTLRHLESTRAVDATQRRLPVWVLGPTEGMDAALQAQGLDLLPPAPWLKAPSDWRLPLFDLALTSPAGQLAPASLRSEFAARRLRRAAYGLSAAVLACTLWAVSAPLFAGLDAQRQRASALAELQQGAAALSATEQGIRSFGVAPEMLHRAIRLDDQEVASAPKLGTALSGLAAALERNGPHHVSRLDWRLLQRSEPACVKAAQTTGSDMLANDALAAADEHRAELEVALQPRPEGAARSRASVLVEVSTELAQWPGATLWLDPARRAAREVLSSTVPAEPLPAIWCLGLSNPQARNGTAAP
jgi:hypothetical protein